MQVAGRRLTGTADTLAEAKRARAHAQLSSGGDTPDVALTVAELVADYTATATAAPATRARDRQAAKHLPAVFAARQAAEVTPAHVGALWVELQRTGAPEWAIHRLGVVLSKAWRHGAAFGWVDSNPFRLVPAPKPPPASEVSPPSVAEVRAIIAAARTPDFALICRLAATTGARRGELCALQWADLVLDGAAGSVTVRRSLAEVDGQLHVGDTKTGRKGHRVIPLAASTVGHLIEHRRSARVVGCPWVFSHDGRTPWRPPYVTLEFSRTRTRADVGCTFHGLRHFAATQWLAAGTPPSQVAGFLGHSSVAMVYRTYAHLIPAAGRDVIDAHTAALDG